MKMKTQTLKQRRKTNTPTSASQARSNCGLSLNKEETLSVADLKTCSNNPEVNQHQHTGERKAVVYVLSIAGKPLMPCTPAKARKLLESSKAKVVKRFPFTIQLNFECENQTQKITFGMDSGFSNIGFSATTEKKELASGTVTLDGRTSIRLTERRMYRRLKRSRLRYREPRFLNRGNQKEGWLPPSTQRRYDTHLRLLKLYQSILPTTHIKVETANFDIQKIMNPEIEGTEYKEGDMYGYQNMRAYLMAREKGLCQLCHKEFTKGNTSHIHHCKERSNGGTNRAKNYAIIHEKCHIKLHKKGLKLSAPKQFKAETFMSIINKIFVRDIPNIEITFGYKTFIDRIDLKLEKTHYNDAFVIANGTNQERISPIEITQKHRNNRSLGCQRKGYAPASRKQRYKIQPKDLVWIDGKKHIVKGCMNLGSLVMLGKGTAGIKRVQKIYNFGSFTFN